jgi:hypothetical protein
LRFGSIRVILHTWRRTTIDGPPKRSNDATAWLMIEGEAGVTRAAAIREHFKSLRDTRIMSRRGFYVLLALFNQKASGDTVMPDGQALADWKSEDVTILANACKRFGRALQPWATPESFNVDEINAEIERILKSKNRGGDQ